MMTMMNISEKSYFDMHDRLVRLSTRSDLLTEALALLLVAGQAMTNCRRPEYDDSSVQERIHDLLARAEAACT